MTVELALALVFTAMWIPMFLLRTESISAALPTYRSDERLSIVSTVVILTVHTSAACITVSLTRAVPAWRALVALALCAAALGLWFWGRGMIGPLRVRRLPDEPPRQLQRTGAFGIVRHPLYVSYLIAAAAPLLVAPRPLLGVSFVLCVGAIVIRALQEERRLRAQLGEPYAAYCRDVKRLIPFVW